MFDRCASVHDQQSINSRVLAPWCRPPRSSLRWWHGWWQPRGMAAPLCAARWQSPWRDSPASTAPPSRCAPGSSHPRRVLGTAAVRQASSHDPAFEQLASCALIGACIAAHFAAHIAAKPGAASCMTVRHDRLGFKSLLCRPRPTRCVAMIAESCELRLEERAARQASRRRRPVMDRSVMDAHCQLAVA